MADRVKATEVAAADVGAGGAERAPAGAGGRPSGSRRPRRRRRRRRPRRRSARRRWWPRRSGGRHRPPVRCRCGRGPDRAGRAAARRWPAGRRAADRGQVVVGPDHQGRARGRPAPPARPPPCGPVATKTPSRYSTESLICAPSSYPFGDGHARRTSQSVRPARLPDGNRSERRSGIIGVRRASAGPGTPRAVPDAGADSGPPVAC